MLLFRLNVTSKKSTCFKFVLISILNPISLKIFMISFLVLSDNAPPKISCATLDIMVNPEARPSIQQHNKEMHALLTGKTSHHHISRTAQAPEQKIRTHFKMPPRK